MMQRMENRPTKSSPRRQSTIVNRQSSIAKAFTLIELLVVIVILALLLSIMLPTLGKAISASHNTHSRAIIHELSSAAMAYRKDTGYYPGQQYTWLLNGTTQSGQASQDHSGSQILAACLFDGIDATIAIGDIEADDVTATDNYLAFDKEKVVWKNYDTSDSEEETRYILADAFHDDKAVLYYPSRLGNDGRVGDSSMTNGAFRFLDNSDFTTDTGACELLRRSIWDKRFGTDSTGNSPNNDVNDRAYKADSFLLFGAGIDREYFNDDDVKNF